ncbi:hypothetical protein ACET3X_005795 [Alternaria dauci]|uniref:Pirin n=1 Tax=Alternaria dauci TaxID=48095 RepID=A0ABR3UGF8_9PLEO
MLLVYRNSSYTRPPSSPPSSSDSHSMAPFFSRLSQRLPKFSSLSPQHSSTQSPSRNSTTMPEFRGLPVIPSETYTTYSPRRIAKHFIAIEQDEGVGMRVRRAIGNSRLPNLTPFVMLDHFDSNFGGAEDAAAPDHPHRGQETITYILQGGVDHEDFTGSRGTLDAGDLQFMTAGRGIMHSEVPREDQQGKRNIGLQLWVDLPEALKYCEPRYRDLKAEAIPRVLVDNGRVSVKVISGQAFGTQSVPELAYTPMWYLHFTVQKSGRFQLPLPASWNAFCYVLEGEVVVTNGGALERRFGAFNTVVFEQDGDSVEIGVPADAKQDANFILVAGLPLDQPIVQYGPFVATSREEAMQAVVDFRTRSNGFERAAGWVSENSTRSRRSSVASAV